MLKLKKIGGGGALFVDAALREEYAFLRINRPVTGRHTAEIREKSQPEPLFRGRGPGQRRQSTTRQTNCKMVFKGRAPRGVPETEAMV